MSAPNAAPSITRTPRWSSAAFPNGRTRCCCAGVPSNPDTACGHCLPASWKMAKPRSKARRAKPGKKPARASKWAACKPCTTCRISIRCTSCSAPGCSISTFSPASNRSKPGSSPKPRSPGTTSLSARCVRRWNSISTTAAPAHSTFISATSARADAPDTSGGGDDLLPSDHVHADAQPAFVALLHFAQLFSFVVVAFVLLLRCVFLVLCFRKQQIAHALLGVGHRQKHGPSWFAGHARRLHVEIDFHPLGMARQALGAHQMLTTLLTVPAYRQQLPHVLRRVPTHGHQPAMRQRRRLGQGESHALGA